MDIPGSQTGVTSLGLRVATGSSVRLPVDAQNFILIPGISVYPHIAGVLSRLDTAEVTANTTELAFEWIQIACAIQVVNEVGQLVPGSTVALPAPFPVVTNGDTVVLPIMDDSVYLTITGAHADG